MNVSIFADSKFVTDGRGNFYSSSNMRKAMLYPIADGCDKLLMVCRLKQGNLEDIPAEDLISHPKIEFVGVPYFQGITGGFLAKKTIMPKIIYAVEKADVCVLRFSSNISCMALPVAKNAGRPCLGHVLNELTVGVRRNPKHVPIPGVRQLVAAWIWIVNRKAFRACDVLCGVTKNVAKNYAQPNREVFQLLDSCLAKEYYSLPKRSDSKNVKAIFAGRLVEFKNIQSFLRAMAKVRQEGVEVNATIVGDGNFKNQLIDLTRQLGISNNVEFTGRIESREKLWQKYRSADIGFLLSFSEGLPLGAIEPMSVGLPLIAVRLDYMKPVITDGVEGFLVDPENISEISEKLKILAAQPELRYKMGLAAYERSKEFSAKKQAVKLLRLAREMLN